MTAYPVPWAAELVLACSKCQRKLKAQQNKRFGRARKWLKRRSRGDASGRVAKVVEISCLGVCPRSGIALLRQEDGTAEQVRFRIIRCEEDLQALYSDLTAFPRMGSRRAS